MTNNKITFFFFFLYLFLFSACQKEETASKLFTEVSKGRSGIDFRNLINENENFNIFQYQYYYNGGGVAVGDFNNDDLQDVVFTGNMVKNRLYINQGDFSFEDGTQKAGIAEKEGWCTGATPVDINQDGWLDLYICRAGYPFDHLRKNLLFVNNGDANGKGQTPTFTEKAAEYGLDDLAHSTQASFFDYDRDGDLDLFLLNHSTLEYSKGSLDIVKLRGKTDPDNLNKLFRNDNNKFTNVTAEAGIYANVLTFSLGISISDVNNDGWPDIFVANDFNEPDYLFINNQNGTFSEKIKDYFDHTSMFSMGTDAADINHDGWMDLVSLDMLPESNYLQKMHSGADNYNKVQLLKDNGFFKQYSRNMLQLNNGDGTFSEIGQFAGVSNTDWSWSPLFFDFENDGNTDLFISNGYLRDHTDMDFLVFTADEVLKVNQGKDHVDFYEYLEAMPPIMQPSYFFQNDGDLIFQNKTTDWSINNTPKVTQGAAYVDLDNDGDLDMIWNNSGDYATVLKNNAESLFQNNYLKVKLKGNKNNAQGIGAKVKLYAAGKMYTKEQSPVRGFQTTVDPVLNFGLGKTKKIDSLVIIWPTGETEKQTNISLNHTLILEFKNANKTKDQKKLMVSKTLFSESTNALSFQHQENKSNDLQQQFLLPYFYSRQGPGLASWDLNKDGLDDFFIGNARGKSASCYLQQKDGTFAPTSEATFALDKESEDVAATFFDADGDGDLDLYVVSGGYEFLPEVAALQDRLYLNDGKGHFSKSKNKLPSWKKPGNCVAPADIDGDGDIDLFVGGAVMPGNFPATAENALFLNDGKGGFDKQKTKELQVEGIVNEAVWMDINGDENPELILAGEWMPITVFENKAGSLVKNGSIFSDSPSGLWHSLHAADFDKDGDLDLIGGNFGTNSQWKASTTEPLELYFNDFDQNGSVDPILTTYVGGEKSPFVSKEDMTNQLPGLRKRYNYFKDYATAKIEDIFPDEQLSQTRKWTVNELASFYFENKNGKFEKKKLPNMTQFAPVHTITSADFNGDGHLDILMGGNTMEARVKLGSLDGNHGLILLGDGKNNFKSIPYTESGLNVKGAVRGISVLDNKDTKQKKVVFGVNDEKIRIFKMN